MKRLLALSCLLFAACSSSETSATSVDSSTSDSVSETSSEGGCVNPVVGAACATDDTLCSGVGGGCCDGYVWQCQSGAWAKLGLGCACMPDDAGPETTDAKTDAGPFACGSSTCTASEICETHESGIDGGTASKSCSALPTDCETTPTCACVKSKIGPSCTVVECAESEGHVRVTCMGV
jgi:hypothetical protein